jgi:hypothetical protein
VAYSRSHPEISNCPEAVAIAEGDRKSGEIKIKPPISTFIYLRPLGEKRLLDSSGSVELVLAPLRDDVHALMPTGSRNETTDLKMILSRMIADLDLCLRALTRRNIAPLKRGFSQSVLRMEARTQD